MHTAYCLYKMKKGLQETKCIFVSTNLEIFKICITLKFSQFCIYIYLAELNDISRKCFLLQVSKKSLLLFNDLHRFLCWEEILEKFPLHNSHRFSLPWKVTSIYKTGSQRLWFWFYCSNSLVLFCSPKHDHFRTLKHLLLALVFKK